LTSAPVSAQHELAVTGVPEDAPFVVVVDLDLQEGWHVYARDVGGGEPLTMSFARESGIRAVGELRLPPDEAGKLGGRVRIEQWIQGGDGAGRLSATLSFMVCDPLQCLPPVKLQLHGKITPLRVLLVSSSRDEHAKRIQGFLEERRMKVTATTYEEVDTETCDSHDVVLAASKLFREDGKGGRKASSFPKTRTPIVAIGFLGTRLIENHGLAMTSGYI
jgi:hypothetical protein